MRALLRSNTLTFFQHSRHILQVLLLVTQMQNNMLPRCSAQDARPNRRKRVLEGEGELKERDQRCSAVRLNVRERVTDLYKKGNTQASQLDPPHVAPTSADGTQSTHTRRLGRGTPDCACRARGQGCPLRACQSGLVFHGTVARPTTHPHPQ